MKNCKEVAGMWLYFFGYQNDGNLYCMKVDHKSDCPNDPRMIDIFVKPEDCTVAYKQELPSYTKYRRYTVPKIEGKVYRRCFWLTEHSYIKAGEIIREYKHHVDARNAKLTHAQELSILRRRIADLEAKLSDLEAEIDFMERSNK